MMRSYPVGDAITASVTFLNQDTGVPQNPQTVVLRLRDPNGTLSVATGITNPKVGNYRCTFVPRISGNWAYRWEASGGIDSAVENLFEVRPSVFTEN